MAKEIKYYGQLRPTGVDNSTARRFEALAGLAGTVQDAAFRYGAEKAQREGEREGLTSGQAAAVEGQPLEKREGLLSAFSIKDNAYNDALESAYLSQVSVDAQEQIARVAAQNPNDVEAFKKAAAQARVGIATGVDQNYKDIVGATLDNVINSYETKVFAQQAARGRTLANESRLSNIDTLGRTAAQLSRDGDVLQSDAAVLEASSILDSMVATGDLTQSQAEAIYQPIVREAREQQLKHDLLNKVDADNFDEAFKALDELEATSEFTPDQFDAFKANASSMLSREKSIRDASRATIEKQETAKVNAYIDAVSLGVDIDPVQKAEVSAIVDGTDAQPLFDRANTVAAFSLLPSSNRTEALQLAEDAAENLENVDDYAALLTAQAQINKRLSEDPFAFGAAQGLIDPEPLDVASPEAMTARLEQAELLSNHYGVSVPPMTDAEISQVSAGIPGMTVDEKIALARTMSVAPQMWGELAKKNQQVFAQVGAIGNLDTQRTVFEGQARIEGKLVVAPSREDYLSGFEDYVGGVYGADDKASTLQAALAHYAGTQVPGEAFDSGIFKESLRAVAGNINDVNGFKTALPTGVDSDQFERFVENIDEAYIESIGGVANVSASDAPLIIRNSRIYARGENSYVVMVDGKQALMKPDGTPLIISYSTETASTLNARAQARAIKEKRIFAASFKGGGFYNVKELTEPQVAE